MTLADALYSQLMDSMGRGISEPRLAMLVLAKFCLDQAKFSEADEARIKEAIRLVEREQGSVQL
jgi:hypothetical protein